MHLSEDYRLEQCPVPEVGEQEVLVKVLAVGICAGDAKCYAGAPYFWGRTRYRRSACNPPSYSSLVPSCSGSKTHPRYVQPPVIPGHEFIGEVVKLGPGQCMSGFTSGLFQQWPV